MTSRRAVRFSGAAIVAAAVVAGCRGERHPSAPRPERIVATQKADPAEIQAYLDAYPLGDRAARADLIARDGKRAMFFVQTKQPIPRHVHRTHTEGVLVVRGAGTCYVGGRSYPVSPGAAFHIAPGVVHSTIPAEGSTVVAITWFEPPVTSVDDDRVIVE